MLNTSVAIASVALLGAYLMGNVPTALWVGKMFGFDPTVSGSNNPGASNSYRLGGWRAGALVLLVDFVKGFAPTLVALLMVGRPLAVVCGAAAVLGHVAPVIRGFHGGKGVATAAGVAFCLWPTVSLALLLVFALVAKFSGVAALGSLAVTIGLPIGILVLHRPTLELVIGVILSFVVLVRHSSNVRRMLRGEENKLRPT